MAISLQVTLLHNSISYSEAKDAAAELAQMAMQGGWKVQVLVLGEDVLPQLFQPQPPKLPLPPKLPPQAPKWVP